MDENNKENKKFIMSKNELFHKMSEDEIFKYFNTSYKGYSTEKAKELIEKYGYNELEEEEKESIFQKIIEQFEDNLVRILLAAAVISFILALTDGSEGISAYIEPLVILIILILNAAIGIIQDINADNAIEALKKIQECVSYVYRNGELIKLDSKFLVPGDVVQLSEGQKVPADIQLLKINSITFEVDQSNLTGETNPAYKDIDTINEDKTEIINLKNTVFSSSGVTTGSSVGIVIYTGMNTQIGYIQKMVKEGKENEETSTLKKKIEEFGDYLTYIIGIICLVVWIINFRHFFDEVHGNWIGGCIYYFKISVALAVAAIPEGLPAVITTCLALGTTRLSKHKAIIRKLHSIEALGCCSIICSDKTGTLTTNNMTVTRLFLFESFDSLKEEKIMSIKGTSFDPKGEIVNYDDKSSSAIKQQSICACLNNSSKLIIENSKYSIIGTPTEGALRVLVEKLGKYDNSYKESSAEKSVDEYNKFIQNQYEIVYTLEFDRTRKAKSVFAIEKSTKKQVLFIKGAVEYLIENSNSIQSKSDEDVKLTKENKEKLMNFIANNFMKKSLRTLALCVKTDLSLLNGIDIRDTKEMNKFFKDPENIRKIEKDAKILSIIGMLDPPRPEVKSAISKCHQAGIRVIMITGDERETAKSIGCEIGLIDKENSDENTFYSSNFFKLSEEKQLEILKNQPKLVFSRSEPEHKMKLVKHLKKLNFVVAMTGDGTNDAPALSNAHIGIAMGISGTEVTKSASHMILADDNFATIVKAIEEGRSIYMNMKAFIRYLISSNIGEVVSIFISSMFGLPEAFTSIQLLWVNLVTDGPPATALSFNPSEKNIMTKAPRGNDDPLLNSFVITRYFIIGTYVGISTIGIFAYWYLFFNHPDGHSLIGWDKLTNWSKCETWKDFSVNSFAGLDLSSSPCKYFTEGKKKPVTLSLTVLVIIEMFNAMNAISDEESILVVHPFKNIYLCIAIVCSVTVHCMILYIPFFNEVFGILPLDISEWILVLKFSIPVVLIDEMIKLYCRTITKGKVSSIEKKDN